MIFARIGVLLRRPLQFLPVCLASVLMFSVQLRAQSFYPFFEPINPPRPFQVMAHRGMMRQAPENTRFALEECFNHGIEWAEVDIRLTRDGRHVLFHDADLDSKSSGKGGVAEHTLAELRALDAGSWFAARFSGARLMTLSECLELARGRFNLYLDCKEIDPALLAREVLGAGMQNQVVVYDDDETVLKVREASGGKIPVMTKFRREMNFDEWMRGVHAEAVEIDADEVTPETVRRFHACGIKVQAKVLGEWDTPEVWRRMTDAGVDWLQTDLADEIIATLFWKERLKRPVLICCHRGANRFAPENTLPAFEKAAAFGADYVEFDVRTSADGIPFLLHDGRLDRTTNGSGPLHAMTSAQLGGLDAGSWFGKPFAETRLPTLDGFLAWSKGRALLYFDAKDIAPEALAEALDRAGVTEQAVVYQSEDYLKRLMSLNPAIKRMPPLDAPGDIERLDLELKPAFVDARWEILSGGLIQICHSRGIRVTSDAMGGHENTADYRRAIEMGIDMIQTDHPLRVIEAARTIGPPLLP